MKLKYFLTGKLSAYQSKDFLYFCAYTISCSLTCLTKIIGESPGFLEALVGYETWCSSGVSCSHQSACLKGLLNLINLGTLLPWSRAASCVAMETASAHLLGVNVPLEVAVICHLMSLLL